jgi:hypothetical protein
MARRLRGKHEGGKTVTATHIAVFTAMQNARRLADSGAYLGDAEAWCLAGVLLVVLLLFGWLLSKV